MSRPIILLRRRSSLPMRSPARSRRILTSEPLGHDKKGHPVYLKDIWPSQEEIAEIIDAFVTKKVFKARYADVFNGDAHWRRVKAPSGETYKWDIGSPMCKIRPISRV